MEVVDLVGADPAAPPDGFHTRGQVPTVMANGKLSLPCSQSTVATRKDRYRYMFHDMGTTPNEKSKILLCVCGNEIRCPRARNGKKEYTGGVEFGNFFRHLAQDHPFELTAADQIAGKKEVAEAEVKVADEAPPADARKGGQGTGERS